MMGSNSSNIYEVLYGAQPYDNSSIFPNLGNWVGAFVSILVFVCFLIPYYYFIAYYINMRIANLFLFLFIFIY